MELRSFWYGLPSDVDRIDAVYERNDHDIVFFSGKKYYILASNSYLKYGPQPITVSPSSFLHLSRGCDKLILEIWPAR